jgi:diketogulonate reductase-like aldo/keto reductase
MPVVGLGTWQSFDIGSEATLRAPRGEVLRHLLEGGGRMVDSSPMYGRAEGVVGDLLAASGMRDQAFLATKVWTQGRAEGIAQIQRSAELFRTDAIDLVQIHNLVDWTTHLSTLRRMKDEGRVRYIGITHYTTTALADLAAILERESVDFVQCAYSIRTRAAEERLLPAAAAHGVAVIVNRPVEQGALFRKMKGHALPPWASELDIASWGQFLLKFIVSHPAVTCVIPATGNPSHMEDNLRAGEGGMPDAQQRQEMARLWNAL